MQFEKHDSLRSGAVMTRRRPDTHRKLLLTLLQQMVLTNNSTHGEAAYCPHLSVCNHNPLPIHHLYLTEGYDEGCLLNLGWPQMNER